MKNCQKPTTPINPAEIIPFPFPAFEQHPAPRETVNDYLWLIKFAELSDNRQAVKEIYAEVLYQRKKARGERPEEYIVPIMRFLQDEFPFFYQNAKRFIERKYKECFPGQEPSVSREVVQRLQSLAEGGII